MNSKKAISRKLFVGLDEFVGTKKIHLTPLNREEEFSICEGWFILFKSKVYENNFYYVYTKPIYLIKYSHDWMLDYTHDYTNDYFLDYRNWKIQHLRGRKRV